ncbi:MAG TPA: hypothetical protein VF407_15540, partial [Polyangiaceae bacterium]
AWANRALSRLEDKPIVTILVLRTVFWVSPPLNYALGWSNVKTRDYLVGSAIGLFAPIAIWSWLVETYGARALHWMG